MDSSTIGVIGREIGSAIGTHHLVLGVELHEVPVAVLVVHFAVDVTLVSHALCNGLPPRFIPGSSTNLSGVVVAIMGLGGVLLGVPVTVRAEEAAHTPLGAADRALKAFPYGTHRSPFLRMPSKSTPR